MSQKAPFGSQSISLEKAIEMTTLFRQNRTTIVKDEFSQSDILPICETFDKQSFNKFFDNFDCKAIRIYYGMSDDLKVHAIVVGVDDQNRDILPASSNQEKIQKSVSVSEEDEDGDDDGDIVEEAQRCPPDCPPSSPLNEP